MTWNDRPHFPLLSPILVMFAWAFLALALLAGISGAAERTVLAELFSESG